MRVTPLPVDIVCLSGNPALDRRVRLGSLRSGQVNRAASVEPLPGGKAAHVAMASVALGLRSVWTGFLGGAIGEECAASLRQLGISVVAMPSSAPTRVNLELIEESGRVTEVLEPGNAPAPDQQAFMLDFCQKAFGGEWKTAILVISGSLPPGMPPNFYVSIMQSARAAGLQTFLDTSGDWLLGGLEARPDFLKINALEAEIVVKEKKRDKTRAIVAAKELIKRGARSAAVTLGQDGLIWLETSDGPAWFARPPKVRGCSSVGSGDTTMAGFAYAARKGLTGAEAIKFAAACGTANCFAKLTGQISMQKVEVLLPEVEVEKIPLS